MVKIDQYWSYWNSRIAPKTVESGALLYGDDGAAMSDMHYPEWQKAYWEASLQVNPEKLAVRIFGAETAILKRRHALQRSSDGYKERESKAR